MFEQNKSPNFPALLQPIWRSDIVEMNAPDKHSANMRRPADPVLSPFEIPGDQAKGSRLRVSTTKNVVGNRKRTLYIIVCTPSPQKLEEINSLKV